MFGITPPRIIAVLLLYFAYLVIFSAVSFQNILNAILMPVYFRLCTIVFTVGASFCARFVE